MPPALLRKSTLSVGKSLRVEVRAPAVVPWTADDWQTTHDTPTRDTGLGLHLADLPTSKLTSGRTVRFPFKWPEAGNWEGANFNVFVRE